MIGTIVLVPAVLAVSSAHVRAPAAEDRLAFALESGASVEKSFTITHALVLKEMSGGGEEMPQLMQQEFEITSQIDLKVLDTYRKVDGDRPLLLQRLFKDAGLHADMLRVDARGRKLPEAWDAHCPLETVSVLFTWVPEEKGYGRHFDGRESLEEYLGGLVEDLDFRTLLPDRAVAKGDTWEIPLQRLICIFAPGGSLPLGFVKGGSGNFARSLSAGVAGPLYEVFGGDLTGAGTAVWKETREEGGARLAVIALSTKLETKRDRTEATRASMNSAELLEERAVDSAGIQWKFEGEGTLLWNLSAGRFESLDLAGGQEVAHEIAFRYGGGVASRQRISMSGSLKVGAKAVAKK